MESPAGIGEQDQSKEKDVTYPIAEIFTSLQGEGANVGVLTTFVRLAGCSVGKWYKGSLTPQYEICTRYDGKSFICDTDFRMKERLTIDEILNRLEQNAVVCITGGEPFDHDLGPLIKALLAANRKITIETSGTKEIKLGYALMNNVYLTVSPKHKWLSRTLWMADEIKVLVDETFDEEQFNKLLQNIKPSCHVFLQPINSLDKIDKKNLNLCIDLLKMNNNYQENLIRVSVQLHKLLEMR